MSNQDQKIDESIGLSAIRGLNIDQSASFNENTPQTQAQAQA